MTPPSSRSDFRTAAVNRKRRMGERGQSLAEFVIVVPIVLVLLLGIGDLARVYASMITIESAAREAADWGANGGPSAAGKWDAGLVPTTLAQMERRACTPARNLPDYEPQGGNGSTCTNPGFECFIEDPAAGTRVACSAPTNCYDPSGSRTLPCMVQVRLTYNFESILALPTITFARDSSFNISYR